MLLRHLAWPVVLKSRSSSPTPNDALQTSLSSQPPKHLGSLPIAYDVTVRSPFRASVLHHAERGETDKRSSLERTLRAALRRSVSTPIPQLGRSFKPLSFDTLGAPGAGTAAVFDEYASRIAFRYSTAYTASKLRLDQHLSYSIRPSTAQAILSVDTFPHALSRPWRELLTSTVTARRRERQWMLPCATINESTQ